MRILVVEDDALLAEGLVKALRGSGHNVELANTGAGALLALRASDLDLMVLDIGLPDMSGFDVLRRLRLQHHTVNVLVLTARDAVEDRVRGLDLGADDYLTKPFSIDEFEARVRALLRRPSMPSSPVELGPLEFDLAARRVKVKGRAIELTPREWTLLELFVSKPGRVLSKEQIAERVFGEDEQLSANAIEVYVSRLRAKLDAAGAQLRTVRGFGYIWDMSDA